MITVNFGTCGVGDRHHHLRAILGDAAVLVLLADHEAGDVLQEDQRRLALAAQLDEVRRLERALGEEDAVVGDDADRDSPSDAREAADQRRAVERLELVEAAAIHQPRDHLAHVEALARIARDDAVEVARVVAAAAPASATSQGYVLRRLRLLTMLRTIASACSSFSA